MELEPGVEGLVHVSEMSWVKKNLAPSKLVTPGTEVDVQVLEVDSNKRRISLGLKQTQENPWNGFTAKHPVGSTIEGEVKSITEFGLFIGLDSDIDGMVHLSDLSWTKPGEEAIQAYSKGDMVKAKVLDIDVEKERVSSASSSWKAARSRRPAPPAAPCARTRSSPARSPRSMTAASRSNSPMA